MAHLIDKDALVAEIERLKADALQKKSQCKRSGLERIMHQIGAYNKILSFLNTLEVKDVDLDFQRFAKEMDAIFALPSSETKNTEEEPLNWEYAIAKHFFKLGLRSTITEEDCKLIWNIGDEIPNMPEEEFFKELLKRFKAQKVDIVMDE